MSRMNEICRGNVTLRQGMTPPPPPPLSALLYLQAPRMDQTSMDLTSEANDANAAGFELIAETFYSGIKVEITAAALLLRRHYIRQQGPDHQQGPLVQGQRVRL